MPRSYLVFESARYGVARWVIEQRRAVAERVGHVAVGLVVRLRVGSSFWNPVLKLCEPVT